MLLAGAAAAPAVPYASQVRNTAGDTWEFVLNEDADSYTVMRDGGSPLVVNNPTTGRHTFDMTGFSDFEIQVSKDAPKSWTELSDASNLHTYYFRPNGVVVNQNASSPYFGTVYVSHPLAVGQIPNVTDRAMGEGIYSLSADLIAVDLANNFAAQPEANDGSLAKIPTGWYVGVTPEGVPDGESGNGGSSPWRLGLDDAGNLIVSDYSDQRGGIKYADPDLVNGGLVLGIEDGVRPLLFNDNNEEVHGSIMSTPMTTGTLGVDLTVWGMDEDLNTDRDTLVHDDAYSIWRWDVGSEIAYDEAPALEIASPALDVGEAQWFDLALDGIFKDAYYSEQHDKFYLTQSRTHGNESSLIIVSADGVDGLTPTIEWASKQWTIDVGLDGNDSTFDGEPDGEPDRGDGIQDVFRSLGSLTLSADGTEMYIHRAEVFNSADTPDDGDNPVMGEESNIPGGVIIVPLDEDGLPDIEIDDNGTPGDTSDDIITNIDSIITVGQDVRHVRHPIALDAAGNVYITSNVTESERLQVFSPGGNTISITGSDGSFEVIELPLEGDFNDDGIVDAADFTIWRDNLGATDESLINDAGVADGVIDVNDYLAWKENFGASIPGASSLAGLGTVPEPAGMMLALMTLCGGLGYRPRR